MGLLNSKQIAELQGSIATLEGTVATITAERDAHAITISELTTANGVCATRFEADQAEIARVTQELATERETREATISGQVTARIAAAGADPLQRDPAATTTSVGTASAIKSEYAAIEDKDERFAFFQKHKAVLLG